MSWERVRLELSDITVGQGSVGVGKRCVPRGERAGESNVKDAKEASIASQAINSMFATR